MQSVVSYWFFVRYGASLEQISLIRSEGLIYNVGSFIIGIVIFQIRDSKYHTQIGKIIQDWCNSRGPSIDVLVAASVR